jgi:ribosomal protein S18 acetylase RimI-like enzyme
LTTADSPFTVQPAVPDDLAELARLFDAYRVFYEQSSDPAASEGFVDNLLGSNITRFFIAREKAGSAALGFVHLIPSFGTLRMRPIWYLEDLFVTPGARRRGIGEALMLHAEGFARANGAERLTLSTAHDNHIAQALYRKLGYVREDHFLYFHRVLD